MLVTPTNSSLGGLDPAGPWAELEENHVPLLRVSPADDFINPPGHGIAEGAAARMPMAHYVLISASPETKGQWRA